MARLIWDKKTGRLRRVDPKKSRIARRAAMRRRGKPLRQSTKMKIARSLKRTHRTGRTRLGRRIVPRNRFRRRGI